MSANHKQHSAEVRCFCNPCRNEILSFLVTNKKKKKKPGEIGKKIAKIFQVDCLCATENSLHDSAKADGEMEGRSDVSCWGCDMNVL